ncbi:conserved hypothetical protein [Histoplasma capsulatum var. duboisii H88]|uniref:Zn(2)-C6 fungal-type domain-containing protein n=1 Tax=Ajellomyces capsulatus (strain H88) TaxID=544711 RepID=F0ULK6_AJEC8|nr:conserved hypothetical protein [Histoplasma capsulatum var. duboisii H88]
MMQGRDENLKCEAGAATRPQPPVQQVQPTPPPPASSPPFGPQPFQPNVVQRPWPGIQPRSRLHLQGSPETETIQTVGKPGTVLTLACLNCRAKKIKCQPEDGGCKKCKKLGIPCPGPEVDERKRPSSKRYIRELHNRIEDLEKALRESEFHRSIQAREIMTLYELNQFPSYLPSPLIRTYPENIIACLCDVKEHEEGEPWSTLSAWGARATGPPFGCRLEVDVDTQNYLLDLYWRYQHTELQVFHQGAFMRDMAAGKTGFYSKTLLYCIMACAARISPRPEIRVLVLPSDRVHRGKEPSHPGDHQCLFAEASRLLEEERENPGVTTIQSLLLLSVIYCAFSNDMAGLALTNTACRLAIEMGLHRDCSNERIPQIDMEARQITFWGCFVFDSMQYCAAIIILYRPLAGFGKVDTRKIETADKFRNICVLHAIKIAHFLADYRGFHNNATTLSGIALHIIEMACTVLISDIAERIKTTDVTNEYTYLAICVQTLLELEQTYLVAQKVRKILKKIIDICNLDLNRLKQVLAYLDARYQTSPGFSAETNVGPSSRLSSANLARPDYRDSTDTRLHGHQNLSTEPHDPPPQNLHVPSPSVPDAPYHEFTEQDIFHTYELPLDQTRHFEQ